MKPLPKDLFITILLLHGPKTTKQLAQKLGITYEGMLDRQKRLYLHLGVHSRLEALAAWRADE